MSDCPARRPGQPLEDHQAEVARWMGYPHAAAMNADHDRLHAELSRWAGATSFSLLVAQGVKLTPAQQRLAALEESAVLHVQRWLANLRRQGEIGWQGF